MGLMVDTNVFIRFEKSGKTIDLSSWEPTERVYVSVVTISELLMGVHRANTEERRQRRLAFVEGIISGFGALAITTSLARIHAATYSEPAMQYRRIVANKLLVDARHAAADS